MTYGITMRKPSELVPYAKNSRTHSAEQVKQVMRSIEEFGFTNPILTHGKTIIAGHCRLEAAKKLGYTEVPTIALDGLTKEQARAYVIADNKLALNAGWDDGILKDEIESLLSVDYAIDLLGFTDEELKDLGVGVEEPEEHSGDPDEVPEVPQNIHGVKRGDIWQLGDHRLMCGDSTNADDVATLMSGEKAEMSFSDPPYGCDYDGGRYRVDGKTIHVKREKLKNDHSEEMYSLSIPLFAKFVDGPCYTWFASGFAAELYLAIRQVGEFSNCIYWLKDARVTNVFAQYKPMTESCIYWRPKGCKTRWVGGPTERDVWEFSRGGPNKLHPTQKPVELCEKAINNHSAKSVLDLFLGSGSTLIACEKIGRKCYGMELDEHYCSVIIERWQQFTNKKAIRLEGE